MYVFCAWYRIQNTLHFSRTTGRKKEDNNIFFFFSFSPFDTGKYLLYFEEHSISNFNFSFLYPEFVNRKYIYTRIMYFCSCLLELSIVKYVSEKWKKFNFSSYLSWKFYEHLTDKPNRYRDFLGIHFFWDFHVKNN